MPLRIIATLPKEKLFLMSGDKQLYNYIIEMPLRIIATLPKEKLFLMSGDMHVKY